MKNLFLMLAGIIGIISCNKDKFNCHPESSSSKWTSNKTINVEFMNEIQRNVYSISDGDNILFEYNHYGAQCDDIYDDEWGERLVFVIDKETTAFELRDDQINDVKCYYQEYGAWVRHTQYHINEGMIKGEKISANEWGISVAVTTNPFLLDEEPKRIEFTDIFRE